MVILSTLEQRHTILTIFLGTLTRIARITMVRVISILKLYQLRITKLELPTGCLPQGMVLKVSILAQGLQIQLLFQFWLESISMYPKSIFQPKNLLSSLQWDSQILQEVERLHILRDLKALSTLNHKTKIMIHSSLRIIMNFRMPLRLMEYHHQSLMIKGLWWRDKIKPNFLTLNNKGHRTVYNSSNL